MSGSDEPNGVLVVYSLLIWPLRSSVEDHLYSFERYSRYPCTYLNLMVRRVPREMLERRWKLIVFHKSVFDQRWVPRVWAKTRRRAVPLRRIDAPRVALPQDDFFRTDDIESFVRDEGVDCICTPAPPSQWDTIYTGIDRDRVRLAHVLTGYLNERTLERIETIVADSPAERPIDIGYRAWHAEAWLGRHGQLKTVIADRVRELAPRHGLRIDVSTSESDTLLGDDWFRFLARCRYTVGVEGGASVIDRDGSIRARTQTYHSLHPDASFEEIERACFPGVDGSVAEYALSPRHLEACATRTCQVLVEGEYDGVLKPDVHYIPVRRDFSNLDEVLASLDDEARRVRIVENAYRDVVGSGGYSYQRLVRDVERAALGSLVETVNVTPGDRQDAQRVATDRERDRRSWTRVRVQSWMLRLALRTLGPPVRAARRLRARRSLVTKTPNA
jgi:hypothetical protein